MMWTIAADGAAAVQRALRPTDDFDALDLPVPKCATSHEAAERVLRDAVDDHEGVVRLAAAREDRRQRAAAARGQHRSPARTAGFGDRVHLSRIDLGARRSRSRCRSRARVATRPARPTRRSTRERRHGEREIGRHFAAGFHGQRDWFAVQSGRGRDDLVARQRRCVMGPNRPSACVFAVATTGVPRRISTCAPATGRASRIDDAAANRCGCADLGFRFRRQPRKRNTRSSVLRSKRCEERDGKRAGRPGVRGIGTSSACLRAETTLQSAPEEGRPGDRYPDLRIVAGIRVFPCGIAPRAQ